MIDVKREGPDWIILTINSIIVYELVFLSNYFCRP